MNNSTALHIFEEKIRTATKEQLPFPDKMFVARLQTQLAQQIPSKLSWSNRLKIELPQPKLIIILSIFVFALLITFIVGPQNVMAAIQNLLEYIPGVGFVQPELVLGEPVIIEREGIIVTVENLVTTKEETVLTCRVQNLPIENLASFRQEHKDDSSFAFPPLTKYNLQFDDGTVYIGHGGNGHAENQGKDWVEYIVFPSLPFETNHVTLVIDILPNMLPGMAPANWEIPLDLQLANGEGQKPAYEQEYSTLTPEMIVQPEATTSSTLNPTPELQDEVQLLLNAVSIYEKTLTLSASIHWENANWSTVDIRDFFQPIPKGQPAPLYITLTDAKGVQIPLDLNTMESFGNETGQEATFIFSGDITEQEIVSPLKLTLNTLYVSAAFPREDQLSFYFTPTKTMQPGDCEIITQVLTIYGYPLEFTKICSLDRPSEISLGGGGGGKSTPSLPPQYGLELRVVAAPDVLTIVVGDKVCGIDPGNCAAGGSKGQFVNEQLVLSSIQLYYQMPTWPVEFAVTGLDFLLFGPWSIQFDLPVQ